MHLLNITSNGLIIILLNEIFSHIMRAVIIEWRQGKCDTGAEIHKYVPLKKIQVDAHIKK